MENASRALLMIGGVLLAMLVIGLLIYTVNTLTNYMTGKNTISDVDNVAKFNAQIAEYDREDIKGYELLSLANKVADYNARFSNASGATNNEGYSSITMIINFGTQDNLNQLEYELPNNVKYVNTYTLKQHRALFSTIRVEQSTIRNQIRQAIQDATDIEEVYGNTDTTTKLAKSISSLIITEDTFNYNLQKDPPVAEKTIMIETLKKFYDIIKKSNDTEIAILKSEVKRILEADNPSDNDVKKVFTDMEEFLISGKSILEYYQFYQFKTAKFKCTKMEMNSKTGRVSNIEFSFVGVQ